MLLFVWLATEKFTPARWYMTMNYAVHSLMYSYYALKAIGFKIPKSIAIAITSLQIIQMILGFLVTCYAYVMAATDNCEIPYTSVKYALLMYSSYFVLFVKFFVDAYIRSSRKGARIFVSAGYTTTDKNVKQQ